MSEGKKENLIRFNKMNILEASKELFDLKGIEKTTMDDIAKKAQYSKSTIYVYFKSKEEIYNYILLENVVYMKEIIINSLKGNKTFDKKFYDVCNALVKFQENNPIYFEGLINEIKVQTEEMEKIPVLKEIFDIGEEINKAIAEEIKKAISEKQIRDDIEVMPAVFMLWASICGIITMSYNKAEYIKISMKMSRKKFLKYSFETLYRSLI